MVLTNMNKPNALKQECTNLNIFLHLWVSAEVCIGKMVSIILRAKDAS